MTPSSKTPFRNLQHPPSMTSRTGGSWHTSIHARELKFGTQVKNHISWWSMMSTMTQSSKYPVRNPQCPPSIDFKDEGVRDTLLTMLESWNLAHKSKITYHDDLWYQGWPYPPRLQSGTINILQEWLWGWWVLDTLLIILESWNWTHK